MRNANRRPNESQTQKWADLPTLDTPTSLQIREHWNELYEWLQTGLLPGEDIKEAIARRIKAKHPLPPAREYKRGIPLEGKGMLGGAVLDQDRIDRELAADKERHQSLQRRLAEISSTFERSPYFNERLLNMPLRRLPRRPRSSNSRCSVRNGIFLTSRTRSLKRLHCM